MRILTSFVRSYYPGIRRDLYISNMDYTVERFAKLTLAMSLIWSVVFMFPIGFLLWEWFVKDFSAMALSMLLPAIWLVLFASLFLLMLKLPSFNKAALGKKMEAEVAVTGRRLMIQVESGKSLINSIIDVAKHKKESSKALERVAYDLYMGKPLERAIQEAVANSPSPTFRKIFIQIRNSLKTGSDMKHTLKAALEDITREKIVEFETFGKKLNPLGLFYMIFGTIVPSLGIVIFVLFLTMVNIPIKGGVLVLFLVLILFMQLFFVVIFAKMRPELEI